MDMNVDANDDFTKSVRLRLENITNQVLDHVESVIKSGSPRQKSDLIRQVFPVLVKALTPEESNQEIEKLRRLQEQIMAEIREYNPTPEPPQDPRP